MTDIRYHDLPAYLAKTEASGASPWPSVLLLFGEEMLVKQALDKVLTAVLGDAERGVAYEVVEGLNENVGAALERVNTFSLLSRVKVVALTEARLFHSRQTADRLWAQAAKAARAGDMKKAARFFLDILSLQSLALDDVRGTALAESLHVPDGDDDLAWLPDVRDYCQQHGLAVPATADPQQMLQEAIQAGFPAGQHLVITTELVDKRRSLFKLIREHGLVVDCAVPKGDRKADRMAQETVLDATVEDVLRRNGKRMAPAARRALYDLTGFDLRTVAAGVEKLVHFTGDKKEIGAHDVHQALQRTRRDPLYAFTEAVSDRQIGTSLFYLHSLLTGGDFDHPLPLLAAVANQMRRLLVAKDFMESQFGRAWQPGCSYPQFQTQVMPAVKSYDEALKATLATWEDSLQTAISAPDKSVGGPKRKNAGPTDLLMAGAGRSPYPIYKTLQKAERFTRVELSRFVRHISDADRRLKRSGTAGFLVLEELLFAICLGGPQGPSSSPRSGTWRG